MVIRAKRLCEFVRALTGRMNEEKVYDVWLHKVTEKTYSQFKRELGMSEEPVIMAHEDVEDIVSRAKKTLGRIKPE